MSEVVAFHHALGLTPGFVAFAEGLRGAGHTVHTPDLFEGRTFATVDEGVAHAERMGFETIIERGTAATASLDGEVVYAGASLGVMPAQALAQTRPDAKGALLLYGCVAPSELGGAWPHGVPVQVHLMDADPWAEGDVVVARELVAAVEGAELFLYPGGGHLFADPGSEDFDEGAAALLMQRVLRFLDETG